MNLCAFIHMYVNGFINSIFGQKDVTVTTQGYNYIALNDDVYLYTGITSVGGDQSNIGFILSNQRTKERCSDSSGWRVQMLYARTRLYARGNDWVFSNKEWRTNGRRNKGGLNGKGKT